MAAKDEPNQPMSNKEREEIEAMVRHAMVAHAPEVIPPMLESLGIRTNPPTRTERAKKVGVYLLIAAAGGLVGGMFANRLERRRQRKAAEAAAAAAAEGARLETETQAMLTDMQREEFRNQPRVNAGPN